MRRELLRMGIILGMILVAFTAVVVALNTSLYSAGGYVRGYLDAVARADATGALDLAGDPAETAEASDDLLRAEAISELEQIRLVGDDAGEDGVHRVTYAYEADGVSAQSTFEVRQTGALFGLFPTWEFAVQPIGVLQVTAQNDPRFTANGIDLVAPAANAPAGYSVFVPSTVTLKHETQFLQSRAQRVSVADPASPVAARVEVLANAAFVEQVQQELDEHLDECATQPVLLPTGCPFGQEIANRIVTEPSWSISEYPQVTIVPGPEPSTWLVPRTRGAAHLLVDIRSLFDGSISTFDRDVPFTVAYLVTFLPDGSPLITAQYE
ncbi:MAG TPA: hypothetical protein VN200_10495 [Rhodoglobus sp.]|nr:hypothetical protein [Rhodoglobus sp.]